MERVSPTSIKDADHPASKPSTVRIQYILYVRVTMITNVMIVCDEPYCKILIVL